MTPAYARLLRYFATDHLPQHLQDISEPCGLLAAQMVAILPEQNAEVTTGLRKLLEAKDCFVRAALDGPTDKAG